MFHKQDLIEWMSAKLTEDKYKQKNRWTDRKMDGLTDRQMDRPSGCLTGWLSAGRGLSDRKTDKPMDWLNDWQETDRQTDRWTDRKVDKQEGGQADRPTDGQTDRWVDWQGAWLDDFQAGRTVRQKDRQAHGLTQWLSGGRQTGGQTDWLTDRQMGKLTGCLTGWLEWWSSWKNEKHSNYIVNNLLPLNSEIFRLILLTSLRWPTSVRKQCCVSRSQNFTKLSLELTKVKQENQSIYNN